MKPINFNKHCQVLKGNGSTVADLPVLPMRYADMGKAAVTCWKLTVGDLLRLLWTRKVYMVILGDRCPVTMLTADPLQVGLEQIRDEDYQISRLDDIDESYAEYQHIKSQWANRPESNYNEEQ